MCPEPSTTSKNTFFAGDQARMDEDGYLYLSDRLSDMILCGGANIYPAEVEAAIDSMPGVRSSVVVGLPHKDLGNTVHAIVDVPDSSITEESLKEYLSELIQEKDMLHKRYLLQFSEDSFLATHLNYFL